LTPFAAFQSLVLIVIDPAEALDALLEELRRQKAEGVRLVSVSPESLQVLKSLSGAPAPQSAPAPQAVARPATPVAVPATVVRREAPAPAPVPATPRPVVKVSARPPVAPIPEPPVFRLPEGTKAERMAALTELIRACAETRRHLESGQQPVIGHGSLDAPVFFVGEAPTLEEVEAGQAFAGAAGEMLRKILRTADIREEEAYFAPLMTWRPEPPTKFGKRPPNAREIAFSLPYLRAQIAIVRPKVVVALGAQALEALVPDAPKVTSSHGQWQTHDGIPVMPTFHPNYVLHNPSPTAKRAMWEDFLSIMEKLGRPISEKQRKYFTEPPKPAVDSAD
jgi:uracil-DNA glycosylase family 4